MPGSYIAAVDIGTTNISCCIYDNLGTLKSCSGAEIKLLYPEVRAVEINPNELWDQFCFVVKEAIVDAGCTAHDIAGLGICTHRNTFVMWDKRTGQPFHNLITWKDSRASSITNSWNNATSIKCLRTGAALLHCVSRNKRFLLASIMYFMNAMVCMRMLWFFEQYPQFLEKVTDGSLVYGCIESWILWKLSGGQSVATEISLASSTGMFDPYVVDWSYGLLKYLGIPTDILPPVLDTCGKFIDCQPDIFGASIPVTAMSGDQQASTFGCGCLTRGSISISLGTGAFIDVNTGDKPHTSIQGLYPIIGWRIHNQLTYLAEARCNDAANTIMWAKSIGLFDDVQETSDIAKSVPDTGGLHFIPAFHGLQAPINDNRACCIFVGIKPDTSKAEMVRAILESIAFRVYQIYGVMCAETSYPITILRCCGGVSNNDFVLETIANLTGKTIDRMENPEFTANFGIAYLAGKAIGFWQSDAYLTDFIRVGKTVAPGSTEQRQHILIQYKEWCRAVERSLNWYKDDDQL